MGHRIAVINPNSDSAVTAVLNHGKHPGMATTNMARDVGIKVVQPAHAATGLATIAVRSGV